MHLRTCIYIGWWAMTLSSEIPAPRAEDAQAAARPWADGWRAARRLVDLHQHVGYRQDWLERDLRLMDQAGVGLVVNLSGGAVTHRPGELSEFEKNKALADRLFPGRFLHYFSLDYAGWDEPDFSARAVRQVDEAVRLGAAGLKEYKRLGLYLRDQAGKLIQVDDARLDPVWRRCGELGLPVSIHVADPKAFWRPYDATNERWTELKDHPAWWFGDPRKYPSFDALLAALNRVVARHPQTTFVGVHFANCAEDLEAVERWLDQYPNLRADLAARIPEIGRHDPDRVRRLFLKHQDRILFGTDFMVYDRLTLGSGGSGPGPTDADALEFYAKHWRWLETRDRDFAHMTPIQGDWTISAIGLPAPVLRKIYFDNARRLLARSWPAPSLRVRAVAEDFAVDGDLTKAVWQRAAVAPLEYQSLNSVACPAIATEVRALWSRHYLYLAFTCPFTQLTVFDPPQFDQERLGLWDRDVVEAFIGTDFERIGHYDEFEVAPTNEKLDLRLALPERDFAWSSGFASAVKVDQVRKIWTSEWRIPLQSFLGSAPQAGTRWRANFYRCDRAHQAFLAWHPTGQATFHAPEKFGVLEFGE